MLGFDRVERFGLFWVYVLPEGWTFNQQEDKTDQEIV